MRLAYSLAIRPGSPEDEITPANWDFEHCASMFDFRRDLSQWAGSYITGVVSPVDGAIGPTSGPIK
jgi:hypothetical protein